MSRRLGLTTDRQLQDTYLVPGVKVNRSDENRDGAILQLFVYLGSLFHEIAISLVSWSMIISGIPS